MLRGECDKNYSLKELFDKIKDDKLTELESFSALISDLLTDCDVFEHERIIIKKTLLEIKDCYP